VLVRITDRCDNAVELRYRGGRLVEVVDSLGRLLELTAEAGRLRSIRLRRGREPWIDLVRYEYDAEGRLSAAFDPSGSAVRYAYRGGVLVKETNKNGLSFHFEYDEYGPEGWCVRTWGDGGIYDRRITYDKNRHMTVVDDARGGRTMYYGNEAGLVDREVDPTGGERRYAWDATCQAWLGVGAAHLKAKHPEPAALAYRTAADAAKRAEISVLRIEALRMEGTCLLMLGSKERAARVFQDAVDEGAGLGQAEREATPFPQVAKALVALLRRLGLHPQADHVQLLLDAPRAPSPFTGAGPHKLTT
jgi:hypothetical protein